MILSLYRWLVCEVISIRNALGFRMPIFRVIQGVGKQQCLFVSRGARCNNLLMSLHFPILKLVLYHSYSPTIDLTVFLGLNL